MKADQTMAGEWNVFLENLAAELTDTAYPVALRHGAGTNWLDLELDLWKAMMESVKKLEREAVQTVSKTSKLPKASEFFG